MKKGIISFLALPLLIISCKKEKAEDPQENTNPQACPTISYSSDIQPIFSGSCASGSTCHSSTSAEDGIILDTYAGANAVDVNRLIGAIKHSTGYAPMPDIGPKLAAGKIQKIECWIEQGKQNN